MRRSSLILFAGAIALGSVGCGGSGNSAAPLTSRDVAVVGVVGADAWYGTLVSLIYVLNGNGNFPPARPGSASANIQNLTSPFSPNQRGPGLILDEYTGYFIDYELQDPNTVSITFYESDSVNSAVKGTGTLVRVVNNLGLKYTADVEIPGGRRPIKSLFELREDSGATTSNYTIQYILGTGPKKRVVEGSGIFLSE